ncbi:MAG: response regulator, partial [Planctomycetes bacterium]|nr:response regulator [Planctomycetota bacterium]
MDNAQVLLIDDEQDVLDALANTLRKEPIDVIKALSAKDAQVVLLEHKIDLIISDECMPGLDGSAFISSVRREHPDIVCIMLSGQSDMKSV